MKIFTQESLVKEVAESMERNLVKNAYAEQQVETSHRYQALERLAEAAELFEKAGNIERASQLTGLIVRLSNDGKEREKEIRRRISSLETLINVMQKFYIIDTNDMDKYLITSAANKITGLLSSVIKTTSNIHESINNLKVGYSPTPKTFNVVDEAIKVANATMAVILEDADKIDSDVFDKKDIINVLKNFGFEPEDLQNLKADDGNETQEEEYWEK